MPCTPGWGGDTVLLLSTQPAVSPRIRTGKVTNFKLGRQGSKHLFGCRTRPGRGCGLRLTACPRPFHAAATGPSIQASPGCRCTEQSLPVQVQFLQGCPRRSRSRPGFSNAPEESFVMIKEPVCLWPAGLCLLQGLPGIPNASGPSRPLVLGPGPAVPAVTRS